MRGIVVLLWFAMSGCTYTLHLKCDAPGARVEGLKTGPASLPTEVRLPWGPWVRQRVTVTAPGHRDLQMDLGARTQRAADMSLFRVLVPFRQPEEDLNIMLIREHGQSGTWTSEELGIGP